MNAASEIEKYREAHLIKGYLPDIDYYPVISWLQRPLRFAVAFSCYYPCVDGHFFLDSELITNICKNLVGSFDYSAIGERDQQLQLDFSEESIDNLRNITINPNAPIAYMNICRWDRAGGPYEYHDLYTIVVFTSLEYFDDLLQKATAALTENNCKVSIFECTPQPKDRKWWQFIIQFLKYVF